MGLARQSFSKKVSRCYTRVLYDLIHVLEAIMKTSSLVAVKVNCVSVDSQIYTDGLKVL